MPDCRILGDTRQHDALQRMTNKSRRGLLRWDPARVVDDLERCVLSPGDARDVARCLLKDLDAEGYIHANDDGGYLIWIPCHCPPRKFRTFLPTHLPPATGAGNVGATAPELNAPRPREGHGGGVAADGYERPSSSEQVGRGLCVPAGVQYAPKPRVMTPRVRLAREVFPQMCQQCGIRLLPDEMNWPALAARLTAWEKNGLGLDFMEDMIWEFGRNPDWARKALRPAWRVFVGRKEDLVSRVATRRQRVGVSGERHNQAAWLEHDPREAHRHDASWWLDETRRPVLR